MLPDGLQWQDVDSSQIKRIAFDEVVSQMYVNFKSNDSIYRYEGVTRETFVAVTTAESAGKYWNENKSQFSYTKVQSCN